MVQGAISHAILDCLYGDTTPVCDCLKQTANSFIYKSTCNLPLHYHEHTSSQSCLHQMALFCTFRSQVLRAYLIAVGYGLMDKVKTIDPSGMNGARRIRPNFVP